MLSAIYLHFNPTKDSFYGLKQTPRIQTGEMRMAIITELATPLIIASTLAVLFYAYHLGDPTLMQGFMIAAGSYFAASLIGTAISKYRAGSIQDKQFYWKNVFDEIRNIKTSKEELSTKIRKLEELLDYALNHLKELKDIQKVALIDQLIAFSYMNKSTKEKGLVNAIIVSSQIKKAQRQSVEFNKLVNQLPWEKKLVILSIIESVMKEKKFSTQFLRNEIADIEKAVIDHYKTVINSSEAKNYNEMFLKIKKSESKVILKSLVIEGLAYLDAYKSIEMHKKFFILRLMRLLAQWEKEDGNMQEAEFWTKLAKAFENKGIQSC